MLENSNFPQTKHKEGEYIHARTHSLYHHNDAACDCKYACNGCTELTAPISDLQTILCHHIHVKQLFSRASRKTYISFFTTGCHDWTVNWGLHSIHELHATKNQSFTINTITFQTEEPKSSIIQLNWLTEREGQSLINAFRDSIITMFYLYHLYMANDLHCCFPVSLPILTTVHAFT